MVIHMSSADTKEFQLTHETLYLLAKLDLHTERLLAEAEELVIANANRYAHDAAMEARDAAIGD